MKLILVLLCFLSGVLSVSFSVCTNAEANSSKQQFHKHKTLQEKFPAPSSGQEAELFEKLEDDDSVSGHLEFKFSETAVLLFSHSASFYFYRSIHHPPILKSIPLFITERKLLI